MFLRRSDDDDKDRLDRLRLQQSDQARRYFNSVERGARLPVTQSLISGTFVGLLIGASTALVAGLVFHARLWWALSLVVAGMGFLIASAGTWFYLLQDWMDLVWNIEDALHVDLNKDKVIGQPLPGARGDRIDRLARMILERYYLDEQPVDRDSCEAANLCSQPEWNIVNQILQKVGIKGKKGFAIDDYGQALQLYRQRVVVFETKIHVRHTDDQGSEVVNLA